MTPSCSFLYFRQKRVFKRENLLNLGKKHSTSVLVQTLKTHFFAKFYTKFVTFFCVFHFFFTKNAEYEDFDQQFGCAAPKHWSKYKQVGYSNGKSVSDRCMSHYQIASEYQTLCRVLKW